MLFKVNLTFAYDMLKASMLVYNFFFMMLSVFIIGLGAYAEYMRSMLTEQEHFLVTPSVFLILTGAIMLFFSYFGFVGALRDNFFLLKIFNISVLICFVLELTGGLIAFFARTYAKNFVNEYIAKGLTTYYDDLDMKNFIDYVQTEFECCGGLIYKDWTSNPYHACDAPGPSACGVPYSCCLPSSGSSVVNTMCGYDTIAMQITEAVHVVYLRGCIDGVLDYLWNNLEIFGGILIGILLPQVLGVWLCLSYRVVLEQVIEKVEMQRRVNASELPRLVDRPVTAADGGTAA